MDISLHFASVVPRSIAYGKRISHIASIYRCRLEMSRRYKMMDSRSLCERYCFITPYLMPASSTRSNARMPSIATSELTQLTSPLPEGPRGAVRAVLLLGAEIFSPRPMSAPTRRARPKVSPRAANDAAAMGDIHRESRRCVAMTPLAGRKERSPPILYSAWQCYSPSIRYRVFNVKQPTESIPMPTCHVYFI